MRQSRLYALYEMVDGKWVRRSRYAYRKSSAISLFQGSLLGGFFSGKKVELRPTKLEEDTSIAVS
jgi:hypothetical protein